MLERDSFLRDISGEEAPIDARPPLRADGRVLSVDPRAIGASKGLQGGSMSFDFAIVNGEFVQVTFDGDGPRITRRYG